MTHPLIAQKLQECEHDLIRLMESHEVGDHFRQHHGLELRDGRDIPYTIVDVPIDELEQALTRKRSEANAAAYARRLKKGG